MNNNQVQKENINMDVFLGRVKREDNNLKLIFKILKIVYLVMLVIIMPLFYFLLLDVEGFKLYKMAGIAIGILGILLTLTYTHKKMNSISYSESTLKSLKAIAKRYRIFSPMDLMAFVFIVILFFGLFTSEEGYLAFKDLNYAEFKLGAYLTDAWQLFTSTDNCLSMISKTTTEFPLLSVLFTLIIICSTIIMSTIVGVAIWVDRFKPLRDNALSLIKEIES